MLASKNHAMHLPGKAAADDLHRVNDRHRFFFSSRRRHTRLQGDWNSDVCSSDLVSEQVGLQMIDDFATPPIDYGLHHEKTEALYLVQLNRRRQREFLAVDYDFDESRPWMA